MKPRAQSTRNPKLKTPSLIEVSAGLVFRDGKLLITQRRADAHLGGLWEFPGGKREPGETFEECLVREMLESLTHDYPEKSVQLKFFCCRWKQGEPQALDCANFKWISRMELTKYEF